MVKKILILDFGSQYTQLIARRIRELGVYSEVVPYHQLENNLENCAAVVLSGSPASVLEDKSPIIDLDRILGKYPVLAICYGAQLLTKYFGGVVQRSANREYGRAILKNKKDDQLLMGFSDKEQVWMSHADTIKELPDKFEIIAGTTTIPVAIFKAKDGMFDSPVYALQFHPEVSHTTSGMRLFENFLTSIVGIERNWTPEVFIDSKVEEIRKAVGDEAILLGLSGGVDSTVVAALMHRAIGDKLRPFFINNGLLRKDEFTQVLDAYEDMGLKVTGIDASDRFLDALEGVSDPEKKRKIIGRIFIEVFEEHAKLQDDIKWLAQGTIYPDVIESVSVHGPSVMIKSHHNVGGLPDHLELKLIEPMRMLFKDEVRRVGASLDIPKVILNRHPFPGPGLAIRILGEITREKVLLLQEADAIFIGKLKETSWYDKIWQAGAMLLNTKSVGVMGDERTYEFVLALRAVHSLDGMTADWTQIPYDILADVSNEIINKVKGINRVVYDISSKPPATIEWE